MNLPLAVEGEVSRAEFVNERHDWISVVVWKWVGWVELDGMR